MASTSMIITTHLRLSAATRGDGWELWELWSHPDVREALFGLEALPIDTAGALLDACKARHPGLWVIRSQINTRLLGCITLCGWPHLAQTPALGGVSSGAAEFSIAMLPSVWGRGYAREASQALLTQVLQETRIPLVQATCRAGDESSLALLESLGFLPRGQRGGRDGLYIDHLLHSFAFFAFQRARSRQGYDKLASEPATPEFADTDVMPLPRRGMARVDP